MKFDKTFKLTKTIRTVVLNSGAIGMFFFVLKRKISQKVSHINLTCKYVNWKKIIIMRFLWQWVFNDDGQGQLVNWICLSSGRFLQLSTILQSHMLCVQIFVHFQYKLTKSNAPVHSISFDDEHFRNTMKCEV